MMEKLIREDAGTSGWTTLPKDFDNWDYSTSIDETWIISELGQGKVGYLILYYVLT